MDVLMRTPRGTPSTLQREHCTALEQWVPLGLNQIISFKVTADTQQPHRQELQDRFRIDVGRRLTEVQLG